jgi:hypothetical protein
MPKKFFEICHWHVAYHAKDWIMAAWYLLCLPLFAFSSVNQEPNRYTRESLMKGKDQYSWPPRNNYFRSAPFYTEIMQYLYFFTKTYYLNEEVNRTEMFPSIRLPWIYLPRRQAICGCSLTAISDGSDKHLIPLSAQHYSIAGGNMPTVAQN